MFYINQESINLHFQGHMTYVLTNILVSTEVYLTRLFELLWYSGGGGMMKLEHGINTVFQCQ